MLAAEGAGETEHHPDIALVIDFGTKGVFVFIAPNLSPIAADLATFATVITIIILDTCDLTALFSS